MDRTTAHTIIRDHQPGLWWALVGRSRCRQCRRRWPCGPWHHARDVRDRTADRWAIAAMLGLVNQAHRR